MSDQTPENQTLETKQPAVFPLTFLRAVAGEDGQSVFFEVRDAQGQPAWVQVPWQNLSQLAHALNQAGVEAAEKRKAKGNSDEFTGVGPAQIVTGFRIRDVADQKLRILSLHSPNGLRADYALPMEAADNSGRSMLKTLADGLGR